MSKYRAYCFTINNYDDSIVSKLSSLYDDHLCTFLVFGKECVSTPHIQGYIEFKNQKTIVAFNKSIGCKKGGVWANCEPRHGTPKQATGYCMKGSGPDRQGMDEGNEYYFDNPHPSFEGGTFGEISKQGARTDIESLVKQIQTGELTCNDIKLTLPMYYHKYGRTLNEVEDLCMRRVVRTEMTQGIWFYGPTGTGKSHEAFRDYSPETHYVWKDDNGWQDGYNQQPIIIINDFRGKNMNYEQLLTLVDKWAAFANRRGREPMPITSTTVIITSSLRPDEVYNRRNKEDSLEQFNDRFITIETKGKSLRKKPKPNPFVEKLLKSTLGVIIDPRVMDSGSVVPPGPNPNKNIQKECFLKIENRIPDLNNMIKSKCLILDDDDVNCRVTPKGDSRSSALYSGTIDTLRELGTARPLTESCSRAPLTPPRDGGYK